MGIPDLPLELHKAIIDVFGEELAEQQDTGGRTPDRELTKTLKTLAFVSRFWHRHTITYIFRTVTFSWPFSPSQGPHKVVSFLPLLDANPFIAPCVRKFVFSVTRSEPGDPPAPDVSLLDDLCRRLENVDSLNIFCLEFGSDVFRKDSDQLEIVRAVRRLAQTPHLRTMLVMGATLRSSFVRKAPNLSALTLCRVNEVIVDDLAEGEGGGEGPKLTHVLIKHPDRRDIRRGSEVLNRLAAFSQTGVGLDGMFSQVEHITHEHVTGQTSLKWDPPINSHNLNSMSLCFELTDDAPNIHQVCRAFPWDSLVNLKTLDITVKPARQYSPGDWIGTRDLPRFLLGASHLPHLTNLRVDISFKNILAHMTFDFLLAAFIEIYRDGIDRCFMVKGGFKSLKYFHTQLDLPGWQLKDVPELTPQAVGMMVAQHLPCIFTPDLYGCVLPGCQAYLELSWPET